jgi:hypothetical protein
MRLVAQTTNYKNRQPRSNTPFTQEQIDRIRRLCAQYGTVTAAEIAKTSTGAISRLKRRGWTVASRHAPRRPRPTDFAIQSDGMTVHQLMRHYRAGTNTILKWCKEVGRKPMQGTPPRAVLPADFLEQTRALGLAAAAEKFGIHPDTLRKRVKLATPKPDRSFGWTDRYAERKAA